MEMKLELVHIAVANVDRAKTFYVERLENLQVPC
jgi:catechol-2,3-dioxygenase